ncbi:MAG: hypothetical protein K2Z81_04065, partial [Cyanobacteria bacterium]|nr:hypothetical protein [Cyanobacteriota bacterium]
MTLSSNLPVDSAFDAFQSNPTVQAPLVDTASPEEMRCITPVASDALSSSSSILPDMSVFLREMQRELNTPAEPPNSPGEAERRRGIRLGTLLNGTTDGDRAAGQQLSTMLSGTPEQREFATAILNLSNASDRTQMMQIIRDQPQAAEQLRQLFATHNTSLPNEAAQRVLQMLRTPDQRQLGQTILNDLQAGGLRADTMRFMLDANFSPEQISRYTQLDAPTLQRIQALRTSEDFHDRMRGGNLLAITTSSDPEARALAQRMHTMLGGTDDQRNQARATLELLPEHLTEYAQQTQVAQDRITNMLSDPDNRLDDWGAAFRLFLTAVNGQTPEERADGQQLMTMINGTDAASREARTEARLTQRARVRARERCAH